MSFSFALNGIFLRQNFSLYVRACVCMYLCVQRCVCICVHVCGSQRFPLGVFLSCLHLTFMRHGFSLILEAH